MGREQTAIDRNNLKHFDIFAFVVFFIVFIICIYRCAFGFDWSDETLYSALSHRFLTGDSFFKEMGGAMQISGLFMLPFTWIFERITGGTEGIILYFRIIYTVSSFGISFFGYRVARNQGAPLGGLFIGVLLLLYAPHSIMSMGYNNILYLAGIFSSFLIAEKYNATVLSKVKYLFGGLMCGIAVGAYPPFIISIPVMILFILYNNYETFTKKEIKIWVPVLFFIIGGMIVATLILSVAVTTSSIDNIIANYDIKKESLTERREQSVDGDNPIFLSFVKSISVATVERKISLWAVYIPAIIYNFIKKIDKKRIIGGIITAWIIFNLVIHIIKVSDFTYYNFITIPVVLFFPAIYFLFLRKPDWTIFIYVMGMIMSLAVFIGSNTAIAGASYGLMVSNLGAILFCLRYTVKIRKKRNNPSLEKKSMYFRMVVGILIAISMIILVSSTKFSYVYRDKPCAFLDTKIKEGPGAGIYTREKSVEKYQLVYNTILRHVEDKDRVLFSKSMPFGYTCTKAKATPRNLFRTAIHSPSNIEILQKFPERMPTVVVVFNKEYGRGNNNNPMEGYLAEELLSGKYEIIEEECGTVYKLKSNP